MHWCPSQQQTLARIPQRRQGTTGLCYGQETRRQGFSAQKVRRSRIDFDWRQCRMPELRLGNAQLCYESGTTRTHIPPLGVNRSSTSTTKKEATKCGCKVSAPSHETLSPCQDHPPRHRSNKDKIQKTELQRSTLLTWNYRSWLVRTAFYQTADSANAILDFVKVL
jgi:hypothetical protein